MSDRRRDVRQLLNQLGLGPVTRTGDKTVPQLGTPRDAAADSLAAFFDSVRRAPAPRAVAEAPPTRQRDGAPDALDADQRQITRPLPPPPSSGPRLELPAAPVPAMRSAPAPELTTVPPSSATTSCSQPPALPPSPEPLTAHALAAAQSAAEPEPLSTVFRRLLDAGQRRI